jgi:hypothetical protein
MRHPVIAIVGYIMSGLIVAGPALTVIAAALSNKPFYGVNYKGLALGTYSTLAVLAVALLVGIVWIVQRGLRLAERRRHLRIKGL